MASIKQVGSPDPKYLAVTDILVGDMSDTNYEFILFDRPLILLANDWLVENFPDVGIKTDIFGLKSAVERSLANPKEYKEQRREWLQRTIHGPDGKSSQRVLDAILQRVHTKNPAFVVLHGGDSVKTSNLEPLVAEIQSRGFDCVFSDEVPGRYHESEDVVYVAAHFQNIKQIAKGYKVHLDHGLKGQGTANVDKSKADYKFNDYFPNIDLHVTAGEVGDQRTKMLLGPNHSRSVIAGYPKADDLLKLNTKQIRDEVCQELGFDPNRPILTYAPAGPESVMKPGGSLKPIVIKRLKKISQQLDCNLLIKLKYPKLSLFQRVVNKAKRVCGLGV